MEEALNMGNILDLLQQKAFKAVSSVFGGGTVMIQTKMVARHLDANGNPIKHKNRFMAFLGFHDTRTVRNKCVTDAFVADIVDALQGSATPYGTFDDYKYHDSGIGTGDEAAGDTALGTPWGGARTTGTQIEGATANIYKSVATTTYNDTKAITEHGLFNASTSGTLMDRTKFAAVNVVATEKIEFTFQITFTSGS